MKKKINDLYRQLNTISIGYMVFQKKQNVENVEKLMPQIQEFVLWFLGGNQFGIEEELYQGMCKNLLEILKDMEEAFIYRDCVRMHDAVAYGLSEYLEMFIPSEEEENRTDDNI